MAISRGEVDVEDVRTPSSRAGCTSANAMNWGLPRMVQYVILGHACSGRPFHVCGKLVRDRMGAGFRDHGA